MIRPITVICWILALGSGLYLYRAKHEVELMDKYIVKIAKETDALRAESRHMLDEWIRLGEPEQLHKYSDQYLGLKTVAPTQFVRVSELASRLPAPRVFVEAPADVTGQGAVIQPAGAETAGTEEPGADELPVPPMPPTGPALAAVSMPAVTAPPPVRAPVVTQAEPVAPKTRPAAEPRVADNARPSMPRPAPVRQAEPRLPAPLPRDGLPPLQAQNPAPRPAPLPLEARPSDARALELARQLPLEPRHVAGQHPVAPAPPPEPARTARQIQPPSAEPARPRPQMQAREAPPAGSLLGLSRSAVPLPLPAPTPVSATWTGPNGSGR